MFTGIVTDIGTSSGLEDRGDLRARIRCGYRGRRASRIGASIACDGVCLTVVDRGPAGGGAWFDVDISAETRGAHQHPRAAAPPGRPGGRVNLERALRLGDELGGHIVSGHVDGLAEVVERPPTRATAPASASAPRTRWPASSRPRARSRSTAPR